jgi:hypothetical protein
MGAKTPEIKASHVPFISHPQEVAKPDRMGRE